MDVTFFELPLDRDLYIPKKILTRAKPPLRVLITDAGCKIAYNTIQQLCSGNVFGEDQEVIIHLINSRGGLNHRSIILELEQCGYNACKEFVTSSLPEIAYKNVDLVIVIASYEEIPGRSVSSSLVYQMIKARQVALYSQQYASKNVKVVFAGPSTKAITHLLGAFYRFAPNIPRSNVSAVTTLDVTSGRTKESLGNISPLLFPRISKALLAAKLKTTTDKIKNIVIWSTTFPDVHNATVRMYPAEDKGKWEMKDVPISEALQDDHWLFTKFPMAIYRRLMTTELLKFGKAVTQALVQHLQYLYIGSDHFEEIPSMALIAPENKLYGVPPNCGFSFPVKTKIGNCEILEGVKYNTATHLNILRAVYNKSHSVLQNSMMKVASYMLDYESSKKQILRLHNRNLIEEVIENRNWLVRYFVTPSPSEKVSKQKDRFRDSKKSIAWDDESNFSRKRMPADIRFSSDRADRRSEDNKFHYKSIFSIQTDDIVSILGEISGRPIDTI